MKFVAQFQWKSNEHVPPGTKRKKKKGKRNWEMNWRTNDLCSCSDVLDGLLAYTRHCSFRTIHLWEKHPNKYIYISAFFFKILNSFYLFFFLLLFTVVRSRFISSCMRYGYLNWDADFLSKCPHFCKPLLVIGTSSPHIYVHIGCFELWFLYNLYSISSYS